MFTRHIQTIAQLSINWQTSVKITKKIRMFLKIHCYNNLLIEKANTKNISEICPTVRYMRDTVIKGKRAMYFSTYLLLGVPCQVIVGDTSAKATLSCVAVKSSSTHDIPVQSRIFHSFVICFLPTPCLPSILPSNISRKRRYFSPRSTWNFLHFDVRQLFFPGVGSY